MMFSGFSQKTSDFLWNLSFNNERPWFNEHKSEYELYLHTPFNELAKDVYGMISSRFDTTLWQCHISRIYRDARRLYGRPPYNDHLWFILWRSDMDKEAPALWFEVSAKDYSYGIGFWTLKSDYMRIYRECIDANPAAFERLALETESLPGFELSGEEYKKPKGDRGEVINRWYNRRNIGVECREDFGEELFRPEFAVFLADRFSLLMPMYDFLCRFYRIASKGDENNE